MSNALNLAKRGLSRFRNATNPPRNAYGWCQAVIYWIIVDYLGTESGARTYPTARAAYNASSIFSTKVNQSGLAPGTIGYYRWNPDDHVVMVVGYDGDRVLVAHSGTSGSNYYLDLGHSMRISHADSMGLSFLGWSHRNGSNPQMTGVTPWPNAVLEPYERRVTPGGPANGRSAPNLSAPVVQEIEGNDTGEFVDWIYGESVQGNNVWFRGRIRGNWFWSGSFTDTSTKGLNDVNPDKPSDPNTRPTNGIVNVRETPSTDSGVVKKIQTGEMIKLLGYAIGQPVQGIDVWFKMADGWIWADGFDDKSTAGLPDLTVGPIPEPEPDPEDPSDYTPNIVTPTAADFPAWIRYEEVIDSDASLDQNVEAARYYGRDYNPIESHVHWWGAPGNAGTHDSNVDWLVRNSDLSANYVTSAGRVTLMVPMNIVAYTTGQRNTYGWKTENDPNLTELGYKTLGFVHYIIEKKNAVLRKEAIRLHKEFTATSCSLIEPSKVRDYAEKFHSGELDPETGLPPVEPEPGEETTDALLRRFLKKALELFEKLWPSKS